MDEDLEKKRFDELSLYFFNGKIKPALRDKFGWLDRLPRAVQEKTYGVMLACFRLGLSSSADFLNYVDESVAFFSSPTGPR